MTTATDEELIQRIAAGDRAAMQSLYTRHSTRVYRFLLRQVRNTATAEDLMSDVFFDAWQQASRFEGRSSVTTWLLGMARFKALSTFRRKTPQALEPEMAEAIEDDNDIPEVVLQKASKAALMRSCMDKLSVDHREVIDLVYYHEMSVDDVSHVLAVPAATVKTRMFYARKRLSELFKLAGIDRGWP